MVQYTKKLENKPRNLLQKANPKRIRKKILDSIKNTNKNSPKLIIPSTGGAGFIPSRWNESKTFGNPNAGSIKDIAYRIMSQSSEQDRGIMDIIRGVAESVTSVPIPEDRYTGSFSLEDDKSNISKINKDQNDRDLNWLVMYGNTKNQFEPITIPKTGFNYSDYLKKHYGRSTMPTYKGNIITADQVPIPNEYRPLVNFLSNNPNYGYYAAENEEDPEGWLGMIESEKTQLNAVDDVNSYRKSFRKNPKTGKPELAAQDLIDYGGGDYGRKWGRLAGIQGGLLSRVINSPVLLDQSIPVKYTEDPKDYFGPGWYYTLKGIVDNNKILEKQNGQYSYPLALPEVEISPNKNKKERIYTPRVSTIRKKTKRKYATGGPFSRIQRLLSDAQNISRFAPKKEKKKLKTEGILSDPNEEGFNVYYDFPNEIWKSYNKNIERGVEEATHRTYSDTPPINVLPEVTIEGYRPIVLDTYYPIISKDYRATGHSKLTVPINDGDPNWGIEVDKGGKNKDYNLVTSNCSDKTLEYLNKIFNKKESTFLFTTPGDVKDFAEELGGKTKEIELGHRRTYIPRNKHNYKILDSRALKAYQDSDEQSEGIYIHTYPSFESKEYDYIY